MTKINRMEMKGFKSFNNKTEILFGNDFNCILGPNGSGKSNVLDSLCFVLGKSSSKSLRAEKSANLIYNGGKTKKPASHGEVSIYFDNTNDIFPIEDNEVKISRIIQKKGNSIYKINDQKRTRNEVLDLMSHAKINPDGYNIILQGDVVRFTEMPTEKRRVIIEDISGISLYEEKKQKAVNELAKVEDKINNAEIVLCEKKVHLKELKKDRDQALKYKEFSDRIKESKGCYAKILVDNKNTELEELQKRKGKAEGDLGKVQSQIEKLQDANKTMKEELDSIVKEIETKGEREQIKISKELEHLRVSMATNKERINSCNNEIDRIAQRKAQLNESMEELNTKIKEFSKEKDGFIREKERKEKEKAHLEGSIQKFKEKNKLDQDLEKLTEEIEKIDTASDSLQKEIDELREKQQSSIREKDKIEFMEKSADERIAKVKEVEKEHKKEIDDLKRKQVSFKESTLELNKKLQHDGILHSRLLTAKRDIEKYEGELTKLRAKSHGIKDRSMNSQAIEKILENKNQFGGVHGTVSELGSVSSKYGTALEFASGNKLNNIVVENASVAVKCIKYLKENKLGSATFLPLDKIREIQKDSSVEKMKDSNGVVDMAINLVKFQPKFKKVFSYILGNTLVVNDINVAKRLGIGSAKMVTLDGDIADSSGAMQGGFRQKRTGGFSELEVTKNIEEVEGKLEDLQMELSRVTKEKNENEEAIMKLRSTKAELEGEIIKAEKSLHLDDDDLKSSLESKKEMQEQLKSMDKEIDDIVEQLSLKNREMAQFKISRQQLKAKMQEVKNPRVLAELNTLEEKYKQTNEALLTANNEIKSIENQVSSIFGPEKEKITEILKQHEKETESFTKEITDLKAVISGQEKEMKEKESIEKKFYAQFKGLFQQRNVLNDKISKNDTKMIELNEGSRKAEHKVNAIGLDEARVKAEKSTLDEDFEQYKGMDLKPKKTVQEYKKEIGEFERMQENLGSINMRALDIYDQIEKEFNSLVEKKDTLSNEKHTVLNLMEEIEVKKKDQFMETFDVVNQNFKNKFAALSTKGDAYLELENKEDPFAGGIGVKVKLSGNKFMDIRSLSGGEKTMTALAFIFAMQEHEPASFYVLDEVDAALDKHNAEKLAKLVRDYCDRAQYIVISHNDGVIGEADNLYGVSMDVDGVSKITSLKI